MEAKYTIYITTGEELTLNIKSINSFIHECFKERAQEGLNFSAAYRSDENTLNELKNSAFVVCIYYESMLIALGCVKNCGNHAYFHTECVQPNFQGKGLSRILHAIMLSESKKMGFEFVIRSTSVNAVSSVKSALNSGFKKVALNSFNHTSYYSVLMRYDFKKSLYKSHIFCNMRYCFSYILCKSLYHADGRKKILARILLK